MARDDVEEVVNFVVVHHGNVSVASFAPNYRTHKVSLLILTLLS